jgi:hypothetical protein
MSLLKKSSSSSSSSFLSSLILAGALTVSYGCRFGNDTENATDVSETVLSCEDAFARLEDCCPGFKATISSSASNDEWQQRCLDLTYSDTWEGCNGDVHHESGHVEPRYTLLESKRVRATSCEELIRGGDCEGATNLPVRGWKTSKTCQQGACAK